MNTQQIRIDVVGDASGFTSGAREAARELSELKDAAYKTAAGFASFVSAGALVSAASSLVDAQMAAQKLAGSLAYSTGSAGEASIALDYLREVTRRLGVDFGTASDAYAKFAAASKGTGISAEAVKSVFEGVAAASMKLGLSAEETSGALLALSQMASKGVVSAEELRGQLGERLPGAMKLAANAMGVTQAELSKMLETGKIMASDFLPKFGDALRQEFQGPAAGLVAEINRLNSAWEDWKRNLANTDGGGFVWLTRGINESSAAMRELGKEAGFVQKLLTAIGGFQFGAFGNGKFDTQQLQEDALKKLALVRQGRQAMESRHLNYLEQEQYRDLGRQEDSLRTQLMELAERRGKETGLQLPDLAGEMQAQVLRRKDALSTYLAEVSSEKEKAVAAEGQRWQALTAVIGTSGHEYEKALTAHNAKLADISKKGAEKPTSIISDYQRLIETLNEKISVETADLESVDKLTSAEKEFAKYQADLASGRIDLANAEKQVAAAFWETYLQRAKANQEEKDQKKGNDLIREYERKNALDLQQISRGAELAEMSDHQRTIAEAVYKAEKAGGDVRDKIIQQLPEGTARTLALANANEILADYLEKVAGASGKSYKAQRTFGSGWNKALQSYVDEVSNSAKSAQSIFNGMADGMADALVRFAQTGKISFSGLANSIIADILKIQAKAAVSGIMGYLTNAVGAYFGGGATATAGPSAAAGGGSWLGGGQSLNAMGAHGGALVGSEATFMRSVSPALFAGAPRFHGGGIVGDEVPAILKPGEGVFTEGQMKALGGGGNTTVIINNQSGSQASTQERSDGRGGKIIEVLIEQVKAGIASDISRGSGAVPSALQSSYGLSRTAGAY